MKIMVTGSRAPAALELMRALYHQGHTVFSADSMKAPFSRYSKAVSKHILLPSPNRDLNHYFKTLKQAIIDNDIEILIPTCEEIFFISRFHKELSQYCQLFLEPLAKLTPLHDKFQFMKLVEDCDIGIPKTLLLNSNKDKELLDQTIQVLKPVYSRFASFTLLKPTAKQIEQLDIKMPYVGQEFIEGKEYCAYAIAKNGKLICHAVYHPKYTAGSAAGIYFEAANPKGLKNFIEKLVKKINFTGQISFDFIENNSDLFVLECNPRATSGIHLMAQKINWQQALQGIPQSFQYPKNPKMLKFAMVSYGLKALFSKNAKAFIEDYRKADDVLNQSDDKWMHLKSLPSMTEIFYRCLKFKKTFKDAATDDIEWNGEPL